MKDHEEIYLQGSPVSDGIAIGNLYFLEDVQEEPLPDFTIKASEVEKEIQRYRKALTSSRKDLHELQSILVREGSTEAVTIIDSHIQMLEDPLITTVMEEKIRQMLKNTESVFRSVMSDYENRFSRIDDTFFQQRLMDVKDLSKRILRHLHPKNLKNPIPENSVVFALELVPSDTAEAQSSKICAFLTQFGGETSHAALIARSKGIPFVASLDMDMLKDQMAATVIVDGRTGKVIVNPCTDTLEHYQRLRSQVHEQYFHMMQDVEHKTETKDGYKIDVLANIESLDDLDLLHRHKAAGIGLFRSEFLFLHKELFSFSEEEQFYIYRQIIEKAKGLPIVFRVFDVGGDKNVSASALEEPNPALGCRAIRYLLRHKDVFRTQVRAILRANCEMEGIVWILLPLISDLEEFRESKTFIREVEKELKEEGFKIQEPISIGSMIEVPSAAITCDLIAKESDFLSIGTNDLVQYTLAADRSNPVISDMYRPAHPSILRLIRTILNFAHSEKKYVGLCGEMASNPLFTALLLGLGVETFSCAPRYIPLLKKMISQISLEEAKKLAKEIIALSTPQEVYAALAANYKKFHQESFSLF
ncbi:MAG: phosphoenolpyruvate--protein phosphotransferase [Simkaniaceae bacterium]